MENEKTEENRKDTIENHEGQRRTQTIVGVGLLIIVIALIGWYVYSTEFIDSKEEKGELVKDGNISAKIEGEGEIKQIPVDTTLPIQKQIASPNFNTQLIFPDNYDETAKGIIENNVSTLQTQLKNDPTSFQAWSDLAMQHYIIGSYEMAEDIWKYLNKVTEGNITYIVNLGNLYHFQLREFEKSEQSFRDAIEVNKSTIEAYLGLHELYRYSYKTSSMLAENILKEGLVALPSNLPLLMALSKYYSDIGDLTKAKDIYNQAREEAQKQGNDSMVLSIEQELEKLK